MIPMIFDSWLPPDRIEIRAHDLSPGSSIEWRKTWNSITASNRLVMSLKASFIAAGKDGKPTRRGNHVYSSTQIAALPMCRAWSAPLIDGVFATGVQLDPCKITHYRVVR